jgi:Electron transfer DM13
MKRLILSGLLTLAALTTYGCAGTSTTPPSSPASSATTSPAAAPETSAPQASTPEASATVAQTAASVTHRGMFTSGEHPTSGSVQILTENGQRFIELGGDFQTEQGPDLFVILHRNNDVIGSTEPPAYSINTADYQEIAPLKTIAGTQRYPIPDSVNLADYQSVAIWCRQFNATFGAAGLTAN